MDIQTEIVGLSPPIPTPNYSTHESPQKFAQRIENDICFHCKNKGHWASGCPYKSPNKPKPTSARPVSAINGSDFPGLQCRCGGGTCTIRTSKTEKNPGRKFYKCPTNPGGCDYFKWCDEVTTKEINNPPQFPFPECACGAGTCSISTEQSGPNAGRNFFVCPIPKGHGACSFFQLQNTQGKTTINGHEAESKHFSSPQSTLKNRTNSGLVEDGDFSVKRLKMMESPVIDNSQHSPNFVAASEPLKRSKALLIESREHGEQSDISSPKHYNLLQDGSSENDSSVPYSTTGQLVMPQTNSWASMIEKPLKASLLTSQAEIHRRQTEFWRQISDAGATYSRDPIYQILGLHVQGWLGRLAFPPSRCLTVPPHKPIFCCVFPSFDPVFDLEGSTIPSHSPSVVVFDKSGRLSLLTPVQAQLSSVVLCEPSHLKSPPDMVQGNIITGSILEAFGQAAVHVQNDLLTLLESMDPLDHESMVREANSTFVALDRLSIDYRPFYERVKEFIDCASSLAVIKSSIHNDVSSQELVDRYNCAKLHFDEISSNHAEVMAAFTASDERLRLLREEASRVKNMLIQIENQLSSCEAEAMDLETRLVQVSKEMLVSKQSFEAASEEAEAWKLCQQRKVEQKAALEKARIQLRQ